MSTGLDTAAGVLTVIELAITLFNGCVKTLNLIATARRADQDIERVRFMLEWEQFRLIQWADRVGLGDSQPNPTIINWTLAHALLDHLMNDLSNARTLKEKYDLVAVDLQNQQNEIVVENASGVIQTGQDGSFFNRLRSHTTTSMKKIRTRAMEKGITAYRSLKWASIDHQKIRQLLEDITYFNGCLRDLLDRAQQDFVCTGISALLRDLISRSSNNLHLEVVEAVLDTKPTSEGTDLQPAVQLKQTRLMASVDKRKDEKWLASIQSPKLSKIKYDHLTSLAPATRDNCETAIYMVTNSRRNVHSHVLLEWKTVHKTFEASFSRRIMELTYLLSTASTGLNSFKCLGFVKREMSGDYNKYAYVFELVNLLQFPKASLQAPQTLRSLIEEGPQLSLTRRVAIASSVAQSILQLHTVGWLHKNISADSVVFLLKTPNGAISAPFISGFEFSRHSVEATEAVPTDPASELYRHPSYQIGSNNQSDGFRKRYDLYSLGCILLEVMLWTSFESILHSVGRGSSSDTGESQSADKSQQQLAHERRLVVLKGRGRLLEQDSMQVVGDRVAFHAGDQVRKAIKLCFFPLEREQQQQHGEHSLQEEGESEEDYLELSVDTQILIVELLQSVSKV